MLGHEDTLRALREAVRFSPDNLPLRQHLADTLLALGRADEAEAEYRQALALDPANHSLQLGLATAFHHQGKDALALTIIETLVADADGPPRALLLHARLLLRAGVLERAAFQYRKATEFEPALADPSLAEQLGIRAGSTPERDAFVVDRKERAAWEQEPSVVDPNLERPEISFRDVGGMDELKDEIRLKIIHPLAHPELYRAYGKLVGGGILLYGPPGCGKTYLARATAGEIKAVFLTVGLHDVLDMWIGNSEKNLHELFDQARRTHPCVLFFDEVDALAASRTDMRRSGGRQLINQFLAELDGVQASNEGVLILAATNAPWHLDSAFRRPGRFDRILFVPPPDAEARAAILRILCRDRPVQEIDFDLLSRKTDGFSGADLKAVLDLAVENKLRLAIQQGQLQPLTTRDLLTAASAVRPSTREWFSTARNYALYANQGGLYDSVLKYVGLG